MRSRRAAGPWAARPGLGVASDDPYGARPDRSVIWPTMNDSRTTRLAPSPTGALHLGNARTFVLNYLLARSRGWRIVMRMEDLDGPRVKPAAVEEGIRDLRWLGLDWDGPVVHQSRRTDAYRDAFRRLRKLGVVFPCTCSRTDIEQAASAPHLDDGATAYPGACRGLHASPADAERDADRPAAWRVMVDDEPVTFDDRFAGPQSFDLSKTCGDFVVVRANGLTAYQLAVVVDDAAAGVDAVVRADDLLESAARQIHLRRLLKLTPEPEYWHLPLVIGEDGRRLAKRHGDTRLSHYRELGVPPHRVLGLLAWWSGQIDEPREIGLGELTDRFDVARVPHHPVTFTAADDQWLTAERT